MAPGKTLKGLALFALPMLLVIAGSTITLRSWYPERGLDDAYISFRYAKNFSEGNGLVFNQGERVEGYSNLLYVLLIACGLRFVPPDHVYLLAFSLNVFFGAGAVGVLWLYARRLYGPAIGFASACSLALCEMQWTYIWSGLETPLVVLLQMAIWGTVALLSRKETAPDALLLAAACAASVLTRIDGFVCPVIAVAYLSARGRYRSAGCCAAATGIVYAAVTIWRYGYYGEWMPNTYYVKVVGPLIDRIQQALPQLLSTIDQRFIVIPMVSVFVYGLAAFITAVRNRVNPCTAIPFEVVLSLGLVGYFLCVGGDALGPRFLISVVPLGALCLFRMLRAGVPGSEWQPVLVGLLLLCSGFFTFVWDVEAIGLRLSGWERLGRYLAVHEDKDAVLASAAVGFIPYYSGLYTVDMLGLCDKHIARTEPKAQLSGHCKWDPDYILSKDPSLISVWLHMDPQGEIVAVDNGLELDELEARGYFLKYVVDPDGDTRKASSLSREEYGRLSSRSVYGVFAKQ